jgi:hypothetical protein
MEIIVILVVFGICGIIGYQMAQSRGKDPMLWGILCFFTGLLGILFLAASGDAKPAPAPVHSPYAPEPLGRPPTDPMAASRAAEAPKPPYDVKKWETLKEVDPDIEDAAKQLSAFGHIYEAQLAEKYLALNDKGYLSSIVAKVKERAEADAAESERIKRQGDAMRSEQARTRYRAYMESVSKHGGKDPHEGKVVIRVDEFFGPKATGWHGGLRILLEDGSVIIRDGSRARVYKTEAEADEWGGPNPGTTLG